jgi:DNA-binding NarL/FixJ family response regulator
VCGQAGHPDELLRLVRLHRPDVAIVDIRMPPTHTTEGLAAAAAIRADFPGVGVLVLSQYVEVSYALRLLERAPGAVGYLLKDRVADLTDLTDALRRVDEGETVIDPALVAELTAAPGWPSMRRLTARGIAQILYVTRKTVEAHVRSIFNKLRPARRRHREPAGACGTRLPPRESRPTLQPTSRRELWPPFPQSTVRDAEQRRESSRR